jgi:radical SAM superfamily enzyme YgiQ (UPF0313 family)
MKALLISTYDLGRQPFGLASPAAWLKRAGWGVDCLDVAKQRFTDEAAKNASLVAFHLPMHTATRLAAPLIERVRRVNPAAIICAYGLYAPLNEGLLRGIGVDSVIGGEFEEELTRLARQAMTDAGGRDGAVVPTASGSSPGPVKAAASTAIQGQVSLARVDFITPDRSGLPPLARYASLRLPDGTRRVVGYTEASRGCKHRCRHCPIVPVYNGQFRIVRPEVVLADVDAQVAAGAEHITFGDPDFFNGPTHAARLIEALHARHPEVSYDVTVKIEHLLRHRALLPQLRATGCAFVTSAVESLDDRVLAILQKGHTREDFIEAVALCRAAGLTLAPTFVAFHPWQTLEMYCDLLDTIAMLDLVEHVAPIQLAIRLLLPQGSHLLSVPEMRAHVEAFDPRTLTYRWRHPDPGVDELHRAVNDLVGASLTADRSTLFAEISALAHERAGLPRPDPHPPRQRATIPYLEEPWYC